MTSISFKRSVCENGAILIVWRMPILWRTSLFLLYFVLAAAAQQGFTSIDCGATQGYSEDNITWVSDRGYVSAGLNANVDVGGFTILETLRYFPNTTSTSNCYLLPATPNQKYLLRSTYYYGNYDNKSVWPVFYTYVDGNAWNRMAGETGYYYNPQSIWTPSQKQLKFCLSSSDGDNVPFISALESRILPNGSYYFKPGNEPFYLIWRANLGANSSLRYPQDPYDRIWKPYFVNGINTTKTVPKISLQDAPPAEVFLSAELDPIGYTWSDLSLTTTKLYLNLFFWDFRDRQKNDTCIFQVSIKVDDEVVDGTNVTLTLNSQPMSHIIRVENLPNEFKLELSLSSLSNSTMPPLLNAIEIYEVGYYNFTQSPSSSPSPSPSPSPTQSPSSLEPPTTPLVSSPSPPPPTPSTSSSTLLNIITNLHMLLIICTILYFSFGL